jgi:hypothetical protein
MIDVEQALPPARAGLGLTVGSETTNGAAVYATLRVIGVRLDLSAAALLNSAGGVLFMAAGLLALWAAPPSRRARLFAAALILFGLGFAAFNIVIDDDGAWTALALEAASYAVGGCAALVFAVYLRGTLERVDRQRWNVLATLLTVGLLGTALYIFTHLENSGKEVQVSEAPLAAAANNLAFNFLLATVMLIVATMALQYRRLPRDDSAGRKALVFAAIGLGAYPMFYIAPATVSFGIEASLWTAFVLVAAAWAFASPERNDRLARRATIALQATGFAGLVFWNPIADLLNRTGTDDFGVPGIIRTIGAVLIVRAILRYDLLGVPRHRLVIDRGPATAAALATMLIVAQVAQNFFEATYGLVLGGAIAGAALFAAYPLQRWLEDRTPRPGASGPKHEQAFADAVRLALLDGTLSREEEVTLHRMADDLGIRSGRAHELLAAVEASMPEPAKRPRRRAAGPPSH